MIATVLSVAMGVSCLFAFAACKQTEESSLWTIEKVYAEAVDLGFEGTLDDLIALFKGETGETGADGVGIDNIAINTNGELIITLSDGNMINAGPVTGAQGDQGAQGEKGKDGATWLLDEGDPSEDLGNDGDMYMNTATFEIFRKTDGEWESIGSIKGADGEQGESGKDGVSWQFGSGDPSADLGKVGDFYLDQSTFNVYQKGFMGWFLVDSIKGADGNDGQNGEDGATWLLGEGEPSEDLGKDGDMYMDTTTYTVYQKAEGAWENVGVIKGADGNNGTDGNDGNDGQNGKDGATWLLGEGEPSEDLGKDGDMYMDTTTYTVYQKAEGAWESIGSIKGEQGSSNSITDISVKAAYDEEGNIIYTFTFTFENGEQITKTTKVEAPATVVSFELNGSKYKVKGEGEQAYIDLNLIVSYSDGTEELETFTVTEDMIEGEIDFTKAGTYTITITYKGCTETLTITLI